MLSSLSNTLAIERFGWLISRRVIWRAPHERAEVALTFDDGPHPENTPRLLDILKRLNVPATFFVIGKHLEKYREVAKRALEAGHELANHTYSHTPMLRLSNPEICNELRRTERLLADLTRKPGRIMRPPMGLFSKRILDAVEDNGYQTVIGDVYPRDPHLPGKERILRRVLNRSKKGSIVILHDGGNSCETDRRQTLWAVEKMIPQLRARDLKFVTLSNLLS